MYKRLSIALKNPKISISLRLATVLLLGALAWFKFDGIAPNTSWVDVDLLIPLVSVALLSVANLSAEGLKYEYLFGPDEMDFSTAFRSVVSGMCVGIWTPNRVGEFAGRMRSAPNGEKKRSIAATFIGSLLQGTITIIAGFVGLVFFDFSLEIPVDPVFMAAGAGTLMLAFLLFFNRGPIVAFRQKYFAITGSQIFAAFSWAALRYAIFSTQFVILLLAFGFNGTLLEAFSGVFLLYAIQSYIPGSFLSELGVREVLSVLFFSSFFPNPAGALLAAFSLWVLNIGLPILSWSLYSAVKKVDA